MVFSSAGSWTFGTNELISLIAAIATFLVGMTILIFVRGNPISQGYSAVNESLMADVGQFTLKQKMKFLQSSAHFQRSWPTFQNLSRT